MKGLIIYVKNDIRRRKKPFLLTAIAFSALLCVIISFYTMMRGFIKAKLELPADYHIIIGYLDDADVKTVSSLGYVKSLYEKDIAGIRHTYILLNDDDPRFYKEYLSQILDKLDAWEKYDYYKSFLPLYSNSGIPDPWINYDRAKLYYSDPMLETFPFMLIFTAITAATALILFNIKIINSIPDYAVLRSYGAKISFIVKINITELLAALLISVPPASLASFGIMKLFIRFSSTKLTSDYALLSYVFPAKEIIVSLIFIAVISFTGIAFICKKQLRSTIGEQIDGVNTIYLPYVSRSSNMLTSPKAKIHDYGLLYQLRNRYGIFRQILSVIILIILPALLLSISGVIRSDLSYKYSDADPDIMFSNSATGITPVYITDALIDKLSAAEGIKKLETVMNDASDENSYKYIRVYVYIDPVYKETICDEIINIKEAAGLYSDDICRGREYQKNETYIYSAFFASQSALLFLCEIFILSYLYKYYLDRRFCELQILRAMGTRKKALAAILGYDFMQIALMLLFGGLIGYFSVYSLYQSGNYIAFSPIFLLVSVLAQTAAYLSVIVLRYADTLNNVYKTNVAEGLREI